MTIPDGPGPRKPFQRRVTLISNPSHTAFRCDSRGWIMKRVGTGLLALLVWMPCATSAQALPITARVGTGSDTAFVLIEFDPQTQFLYEVAFTSGAIGSGDEVYSIDLLRLLEAELTDFSFVSTDYGPDLGRFVEQITVGVLTEPGVIGVRSWGDDLWGYWARDSGDVPFETNGVGTSNRVMFDGSWEVWSFDNFDVAPTVPEPI